MSQLGSLWGRSAGATFESLLGHFDSFCVSVELGARPLHKGRHMKQYVWASQAAQACNKQLEAKNWGTTKKLCDKDFAERSSELSDAICLQTLVLQGNDPVTPRIVQKLIWRCSCDFWLCESFLAPDKKKKQIQKYQETPRLHKRFRKVRANFSVLCCGMSQEPRRDCLEKLVQMNFFVLVSFLGWIFILRTAQLKCPL